MTLAACSSYLFSSLSAYHCHVYISILLASSHQLYAELWLDFLSFAGTFGRDRIVFPWHCSILFGDHPAEDSAFIPGFVSALDHWLGVYLHFCTYSTCIIFLSWAYFQLRSIYGLIYM